MPVSHIGLTVSHLPTSTSFFLSALQPLGYRYIGESYNQIGLGVREADFFLCQETPGIKAGAAHIAFTAPSTTAVRNFYTAALTAGGRPNGSPSNRSEDGHFNAAVLDFDGNSIEVVYRGGPDFRDDGTVYEHSRVIEWQRRSVSESYREYRSTVSTSTRTSTSRAAPSEAGSKAATEVSKAAPSVARSVSAPAAVPQATNSDAGGSAAKQILGTLLGAAAGAAVAYAFVRSEQDSAKKESDFSAFMDAKNTVKAAAGLFAQATGQTQPPTKEPPLAIEAPPAPQSVHRNIDTESVHSSTPPPAQSVYAQRQIEAAPASYYAASSVSRARSQVAEPLAIEYEPAYSVAPSKAPTRLSSAQRSYTCPEPLMIEQARSVASTIKPESVVSTSKRTKSIAHSAAPSSFISSFVADNKSSTGSVHSHHSSRSKRSSHTHTSKHSRVEEESSSSPPASEAPSKAHSKASSKSPPPKPPSKAASLVSSVLGRNAKSVASKYDEDFIDDLEIEELTEDDFETVVPSDSISNVGSSRSHRSHRSHRSKKDKDVEGSVVSKQSSSSKHSKHSSHRSHRSHKSRSHHSGSDSENDDTKSKSSSRHHRSSRPSVFSEPSDASTVKPIKPSSSSRHKDRKDSLTQISEYDGLFDQVQYGTGSVAVRGITPSMVSAANKNQTRTMVVGSIAQKMRNFEGSQAGKMTAE